MKLNVKGIEVSCIVGDRPDERVRPQTLRVDVSLDVSDRAAETDDLSDAADYAVLAERIRARLVVAKCRLVERAAKLVCEVCLGDPAVRAATATVVKAGAVPGLVAAEAVYACRRGEGGRPC